MLFLNSKTEFNLSWTGPVCLDGLEMKTSYPLEISDKLCSDFYQGMSEVAFPRENSFIIEKSLATVTIPVRLWSPKEKTHTRE